MSGRKRSCGHISGIVLRGRCRPSCPDGIRAHPRPYQPRSLVGAGFCTNQVFGNAERVFPAITVMVHSSQLVVGDSSSVRVTPRLPIDGLPIGGGPVPGLNQAWIKAPFVGSYG
jgi:hypothetical protein